MWSVKFFHHDCLIMNVHCDSDPLWSCTLTLWWPDTISFSSDLLSHWQIPCQLMGAGKVGEKVNGWKTRALGKESVSYSPQFSQKPWTGREQSITVPQTMPSATRAHCSVTKRQSLGIRGWHLCIKSATDSWQDPEKSFDSSWGLIPCLFATGHEATVGKITGYQMQQELKIYLLKSWFKLCFGPTMLCSWGSFQIAKAKTHRVMGWQHRI